MPFDYTKFTDKAWEAIVEAQDVTRRFQQRQMEVEHLTITLLELNEVAGCILNRAGVDPTQLRQQLEAFSNRQPIFGKTEDLYLGQYLSKMLDRAEAARTTMQEGYVSVEHLLLAFAEDERIGRRLLKGFNMDAAKLNTVIKTIRGEFIQKDAFRSHKDLNVYKKTFEAAMHIFEISKRFPVEEKYSLTDQIRHSSRSVCVNFAEAWSKRWYGEAFVAKLNDCEVEVVKTQTWIEFAVKCKYVDVEIGRELYETYSQVFTSFVNMSKNPSPYRQTDMICANQDAFA